MRRASVILLLTGLSTGCGVNDRENNMSGRTIKLNSSEESVFHRRLTISDIMFISEGEVKKATDILDSSTCKVVKYDLSKDNVVEFGDIHLNGETQVYELMNAYPFEFETQFRHLRGNLLGGSLVARAGLHKGNLVIVVFTVKSAKVKQVYIYG